MRGGEGGINGLSAKQATRWRCSGIRRSQEEPEASVDLGSVSSRTSTPGASADTCCAAEYRGHGEALLTPSSRL